MSIYSHKWKISTGLAIAAIALPIVLFIISIEDKNLEYEIISHSELVGKKILVEGLQIKMKGETIDTLSIHSLKIQNSGSKPILTSDFEKPLSIYFKNKAKIFSIIVKKKNPENLSLTSRIIDNCLLIDPLLLNPGDEFEIDVYSSSNEHPTINARIAGISNIARKSPESKDDLRRLISAVLLCFILLFYGKSLVLAVPIIGKPSKLSIRIDRIALFLICGGSAGLILSKIFEIKSITSMPVVLSIIPVWLGCLWGIIEKYNANSADS